MASGQLLDSLTLGCDCLGHIHYFDAWSHDWHGQPKLIRNAICMHEEDFGTLWKYTDWITGQVTVKRSRRLVISWISTIGNYVYGFFWYFYQDGTIGVEVKATGIPFASGIAGGREVGHGALVAPGIEAHVHQHVFGYRFDMAVDGERNSVKEVNFAAVPMGPATRMATPSASPRRRSRPSRPRSATSTSPRSATGRSLIPIASMRWASTGLQAGAGRQRLSLPAPGSPVGQARRLHVSPLLGHAVCGGRALSGRRISQPARGRRRPAGMDRRPTARSTTRTSWCGTRMNYHHLPRPEDWPVQPCVYAAFHWMPSGFFDANPALDVPSPRAKEACCS